MCQPCRLAVFLIQLRSVWGSGIGMKRASGLLDPDIAVPHSCVAPVCNVCSQLVMRGVAACPDIYAGRVRTSPLNQVLSSSRYTRSGSGSRMRHWVCHAVHTGMVAACLAGATQQSAGPSHSALPASNTVSKFTLASLASWNQDRRNCWYGRSCRTQGHKSALRACADPD